MKKRASLLKSPVGLVVATLLVSSPHALLAEAQNVAAGIVDVGAEIDEAAKVQNSVVTLKPGTYRLPEKGITIRNAKNLTIDGGGARLIAPNYSAMAFKFENCDGITLKNFTLDFDPLPYTQGTITAIAPDFSWIEVNVHDGYPDLLPEFSSQRLHFFDGETRGWKRVAAEGSFKEIERYTPRSAKLTLNLDLMRDKAKHLRVGDMYAITMRGVTAVSFFRTDNVVMEDVTIQSAPGLAIVSRNGGGDCRFVRCKVERGPLPAGATEPRLLSTNCDALNFAYARKGPLIEDCEFSFMGDDGINLHGPAFQVVHVEPPNVIWCLRRTVLKEIKPFYDNIIVPGDPVRFLAADNFAIKGGSKVVSLETDIQPSFQLTRKEIEASAPISNYKTEKFLKITLDDASGIQKGDVVDFPASSASDYVIRGNKIHDVRPRGMRIMASRGVIEKNYVARTTQPGICIGAHYATYREAGWVSDLVISENVLEDIGLGADVNQNLSSTPGAISVWTETALGVEPGNPAPPHHQRIRIINNRISNSSGEAIVVSGVSDGVIEGNIIDHCNIASPTDPFYKGKGVRGYGIVLLDSPGTVVKDNVLKDPESCPNGFVYRDAASVEPPPQKRSFFESIGDFFRNLRKS